MCHVAHIAAVPDAARGGRGGVAACRRRSALRRVCAPTLTCNGGCLGCSFLLELEQKCSGLCSCTFTIQKKQPSIVQPTAACQVARRRGQSCAVAACRRTYGPSGWQSRCEGHQMQSGVGQLHRHHRGGHLGALHICGSLHELSSRASGRKSGPRGVGSGGSPCPPLLHPPW